MSDDSFLPFLRTFADSLPSAYRDRHDARAITDHAKLALDRSGGEVRVGSFRCTRGRGLPVCVVVDDGPGLLSRVAAAFVMSRLDVVEAEAYSRTTATGVEAVDLFWVRDAAAHGDGLWIGPEEIARFRGMLVVLLDDTLDPASLERSAPAGFGGTRMRFVTDDAGSLVAIDIETLDRPGLLFTLTSALFAQRLRIERSEIRTVRGRVFDRFYVREMDGAAVPAERREPIEREISRALRSPSGNPPSRDAIV